MNDAAKDALFGIVARHGASVATDARRCEALLRDYCGQFRREVSVLTTAVEEGVPRDLLAGGDVPPSLLLSRLVNRLVDHHAISEDAARWAVTSWAAALGIVSQVAPPPEPPHPLPPAQTIAPSAPQPAASGATVRAALVVSPNGRADHTTISEALADAAPGTRIVIRPGVYEEGLVLDRPVEIVGDGPVDRIVVRSASASCIRVVADGAIVRGLTLRCVAGRTGEGFFAVDAAGGDLLLENCDVSSDSLAVVGIHGPGTRPTVRRCAIHDGADAGVYVFDGATGIVEACDVYANMNVGIAITDRGNPTVRHSRIFRGRNAGVVSWAGGAGRLEGCEIFGNAQAGVGISEGGDPVVSSCRIQNGENAGVFVHDAGRGTITDCEISGHRETELAITRGGAPVVRGCSIHDGKVGVFVSELGAGLIEGCRIERNSRAGVVLAAGAGAVIHGCRIRENGGPGVVAEEDAAGEIVECDLAANADGAWSVDRRSAVRTSGNRE
jgi:nitrous oxidase accessory protein NosD